MADAFAAREEASTVELSPSLDVLVTRVATHLIGADAPTAPSAYRAGLRDLRDWFGVDTVFLRHHDSHHRITTLVAEWPQREHVPDPDPLGVVGFADADPVFAATEHLQEPLVFRPGSPARAYAERVESASGMSSVSMVAVPLLSGPATTGVLGLVAAGDRQWTEEELGALKATASLFSQVQARVSAEERLRWAARHDALTGLLNRRGMTDELSARLADGRPRFAVLYFDLDRLEALNDVLGHTAGDEFLRTVAERLRRFTDDDSLLCRWGGDEFVLLLPGASTEDEAYVEACSLLMSVTARVELAGDVVSRTASIGVAVARPGIDTVDSVIAGADQAAIAAKSAGGNAVSLFTDEIRERTALRNDIELHLRAAIENDALLLHFQPEIDLTTGRITAVEALVRWLHPTRGMIPPADFVGIAESVNLATELGRWVLNEACRTYASWRQRLGGSTITLRVNVSPAQLVSRDFIRVVETTLARHAMSPADLCIEITEVAVVHDVTLAARALAAVRALGVRVAIDDFGTGYSSLSHLKTLPVDAVKIDREFVAHLDTDADDRAIVGAVVTLAKAYRLDLIAEGLETVEARTALLDLGCTRAQGYLYARPEPAETVYDMLRVGTLTPS
ncbi:putative bifunctional diguanylate cyclase/phosphodiesterase [Rhodococcoides corynebacterioides]|uniref:putative bifunctional diguanylate cyclase/phosphodiesterase n=1 Tax=Rhodococcoides corynebacterioides TaxID=53972 RepID=UPI001FE90DD1|nr:EAL domain-containing protein [Rhodococcus corynebacterioides]